MRDERERATFCPMPSPPPESARTRRPRRGRPAPPAWAVAGLATVALLGAAAPAPAATRFSGKTRNGGAVSFRVSGGAVSRFQATLSITCVSAAPARTASMIYVVAPAAPSRVSKRGTFSFSFKRAKEQFRTPKTGILQTLYAVRGTGRGAIAGRRASGTVKVTYSLNWLAYNPATGFSTLTIAACFSSTNAWAARRA